MSRRSLHPPMRILFNTLCLVMLAVGLQAQTIYPPATQAQVNAGMSRSSFVSPATLAGSGVSAIGGNYAAALGITDAGAQSDLVNAVNELKNSGAYTNLVDFIPFKGRFNPGSNGLTLMGRTYFASNVTWSANCNLKNSLIRLDGLPDLRTSTVVCVFSHPLGSAGQFVFGVGDTTFGSAVWEADQAASYFKIGYRCATNYFADSNQQYTNLLMCAVPSSAPQYNFADFANQRFVDAVSLSGVNYYHWRYAVQSEISLYAPSFTGAASFAITNPMTSLYLGSSIVQNSPFLLDTPWQGQIACVFVFNCVATTNILISAQRSAQWLEPETTINVAVGHSLIANDNAQQNQSNTNTFFWFLTNRGVNATNTCNYNFAQGGSTLNGWDNAWNYQYLFTVPLISKVTGILYLDCGVNDTYNLFTTAAAQYGHTLKIANAAHTNGWRIVVATQQQIWRTNCTAAGGYAWTAPLEAVQVAYNNLLVTNYWNFDGFIRRDLITDQTMLSTNRVPPLSNDGLHFHLTANSWQVYSYIAGTFQGIGDYGFRQGFSFDGPTSGQPYVVTNGLLNGN